MLREDLFQNKRRSQICFYFWGDFLCYFYNYCWISAWYLFFSFLLLFFSEQRGFLLFEGDLIFWLDLRGKFGFVGKFRAQLQFYEHHTRFYSNKRLFSTWQLSLYFIRFYFFYYKEAKDFPVRCLSNTRPVWGKQKWAFDFTGHYYKNHGRRAVDYPQFT